MTEVNIRYWRELEKNANFYLDEVIKLRKKYKLDKVKTKVSHLEEESRKIIKYFPTIMIISIGIPYFIVIVIVGILLVALIFSRLFCVINEAGVLIGCLIFSVMLGTIPIMVITIKSRIHHRFNIIWNEIREKEVKKQ